MDGIAAGGDGKLWFTDYAHQVIGALSPAGALREYAIPSRYNGLNDIASGPDGALWFTEQEGVVGRITASGVIDQIVIPTPDSQPDGVTAGPGATIWFTEMGANRIGRITL